VRRNSWRAAPWVVAGLLLAATAVVGVILMSGSATNRVSQRTTLAKLSQEDLVGARGEPGVGDHGDNVSVDATAPEEVSGPAEEAYLHRAYPAADVPIASTLRAQSAWTQVKARGVAKGQSKGLWSLIGPSAASFPAVLTFSDHDYVTSGRTTALAIAPNCSNSRCRLYVGAAGGGIWRTDNGLSPSPNWTYVSGGLATNAIGAITLAPGDATGNTLYVGTGEPNSSGDSEAGLGIYKSTDGGNTWSHLAASTSVPSTDGLPAYTGPAFDGRSIAEITIDPSNANTIYVASTRGVRGVGAPGGAFSLNPNFPPVGLWKSTDGGASFTLLQPQGVLVNPLLTGGAFISSFGSLRGVDQIEFDPSDTSTLYTAAFGKGVLMSTDSGANWSQLKAPVSTASTDRPAFAVVTKDSKTRMYLGDGSNANNSRFFRNDDVKGTPGNFKLLSTLGQTPADRVNPYYGTFNYCTGQCSYDNFVVSPAGHPDEVYLGGSFQYSEYGLRSNGRGVLRSTNAGEQFTDMTWDATADPGPNGIHPDQHALVVNPNNDGMFFESSDGGVVRSSGDFTDASAQCDSRPLSPSSLVACHRLLSSIPTRLFSLNKGLSTLQFSTLSVNPTNPKDLMGGTQDNGTFETTGSSVVWPQIIYGDGGLSGFDVGNPAIRFNQFFLGATDTNFRNGDPTKWVVTSGPLAQSKEAVEFYWAQLTDPVVAGTMYTGFQHVWRTLDDGGSQSYLEANCPEFTTAFNNPACGDWGKLGGATGDLTSSTWGDRDSTLGATPTISQLARTPSDSSTLWASTDSGRLFISHNANAANPDNVTFTRLDSLASNDPERYISGIYVDPANSNHAWISYSGYNAHTPSTPGHVFSVTYDSVAATATWTDLSYNLDDLPITSIVRDDATGDLYASTDFGVMELAHGTTSWQLAAGGMPNVEVSSLTIVPGARVLYAATHGRSAWKLALG